jgi:hypothetical protein
MTPPTGPAPGGSEPISRELNLQKNREELLAHEEWLKRVIELRTPSKRPGWYESAALVGLATLVLTGVLNIVAQHLEARSEQRVEARKERLAQTRTTVRELTNLVSSLLLSSEDRAKIGKGRYGSLGASQLNEIVDSTNVTDTRWRYGRHQSGLLLKFYFASDSGIDAAWLDARKSLQDYSDCAEEISMAYWKSKKTLSARPDACDAQRDTATSRVDLLNRQLIRGYLRLETP